MPEAECIHSSALTGCGGRRTVATMGHTRKTLITSAIPTVEQVARSHRVSRRRVKQLENLIESFIARDARRRRGARTKSAKARER